MAKKKKIDASSDVKVNAGFAALAALKSDAPDAPEASEPEPAKPKTKRRFGPKVVLQRETKGRAGKTVVRVRGLELPEKELTALCKKMKKKLGCGAQVEEQDILLLGSVSERAKAFLESEGARKVILGN